MATPKEPVEDALTNLELENQSGQALPAREAMTTIDVSGVDNFAAPINEATAVNINSTDSYAIADADQIVILNQDSVDVDPGTTTEGVITHGHGKDL
jgi:nucleoside 2-deoxyribosyltransferase